MRSRSVAFTLALALALAGSTGCANMTRNQKQGLAVLGGAAIVIGGTVMVDGWSCDEANWHNGSCDHDRGELIKGGTTMLAGGALLTYALLKLAGHAPDPESTRTASAKTKTAGK